MHSASKKRQDHIRRANLKLRVQSDQANLERLQVRFIYLQVVIFSLAKFVHTDIWKLVYENNAHGEPGT